MKPQLHIQLLEHNFIFKIAWVLHQLKLLSIFWRKWIVAISWYQVAPQRLEYNQISASSNWNPQLLLHLIFCVKLNPDFSFQKALTSVNCCGRVGLGGGAPKSRSNEEPGIWVGLLFFLVFGGFKYSRGILRNLFKLKIQKDRVIIKSPQSSFHLHTLTWNSSPGLEDWLVFRGLGLHGGVGPISPNWMLEASLRIQK